MPSVSEPQKVAMQLAAAGKSNLGIPKEVGKEFVKADAKKKRVAKSLRRATKK